MDDFNYKQTIKDLEEEINSLEDTIIDKDSKIADLENEIDCINSQLEDLESQPSFDDILTSLVDDHSIRLSEVDKSIFSFYVKDMISRVKAGCYNHIIRSK